MKKKKKATVSTPVKELARSEELRHYMSILIEDVQSKLDLVVEGMNALRSEMDSKINGVRSEIRSLRNDMNSQFSLLNSAIRCNADDIRELSAKMDRVVDRVDDHDDRIGRVEKVS